MPEMPEIETLVRKLRKIVLGKRIKQVYVSGLPLRKPIEKQFASILEGRTIRKILRRGKFLVLELEPRAFWIMHLGMSGRVLHHSSSFAGTKHTHAIVRFTDLTELEYRDPRRFGLLSAYEVAQLSLVPEVSSLGRDPMSCGFHDVWLGPLLKSSRQAIKSFLLNQRRIAGIGNIYASEALFHARIHPARYCYTLDYEETRRLIRSIRHVLRNAVRHAGTSFSDFTDTDGNPGENQAYLAVFQREGKGCTRCGTPIKRLLQGNRSSFFCSCCQK